MKWLTHMPFTHALMGSNPVRVTNKNAHLSGCAFLLCPYGFGRTRRVRARSNFVATTLSERSPLAEYRNIPVRVTKNKHLPCAGACFLSYFAYRTGFEGGAASESERFAYASKNNAQAERQNKRLIIVWRGAPPKARTPYGQYFRKAKTREVDGKTVFFSRFVFWI